MRWTHEGTQQSASDKSKKVLNGTNPSFSPPSPLPFLLLPSLLLMVLSVLIKYVSDGEMRKKKKKSSLSCPRNQEKMSRIPPDFTP